MILPLCTAMMRWSRSMRHFVHQESTSVPGLVPLVVMADFLRRIARWVSVLGLVGSRRLHLDRRSDLRLAQRTAGSGRVGRHESDLGLDLHRQVSERLRDLLAQVVLL